jgi:hypothetical protein
MAKNGTTKKQLKAGLKFTDIVKAQGGVATNPQTGAKTYHSSNAGASSARDIDAVVDDSGRVIKQAAPVPEFSGGGSVNARPVPTLATIEPTAPVITSEDNLNQFNQDSTSLNEQAAAGAAYTQQQQEKTVTNKETGIVTDKGAITTTTSSGDPLYDRLATWEKEQAVVIKKEAEKRKKDYEKLYNTSLAAIDSTTNATIQGLNSTYAKRVDEQERINNLDVARVKAYGLSEGGRYVPIMFGDAVSAREQEGADKIMSLESQRNSLISEAKAARDRGQSALLRSKMEDLAKVDADIRSQLKDVQQESQRQYQVLREVRKEVEAKHQAKIDKALKQLASIAPMFIDDFDKMDSTGKDAFINQLVASTGLDYASIYGILNTASVTNFNQKYDREFKGAKLHGEQLANAKTEGDIAMQPLERAMKEANIRQSNASAAASYASAARSRAGSTSDPKMTKADTMNNVEAYMNAKKGQDGRISPDDWNAARLAWANDGHKVEDFDNTYKNTYINKDHEWNYGFDD